MDVIEFVECSIGRWRSQRSGHSLAMSHFEEVRSTIDIVSLPTNATEVIELCKSNGVDISQAISPFQMSWKGESDWDESETLEGSCILVPIPDKDNLKKGKLLRSQGYAETIPAAGEYYITEDGTFILNTEYDHAAAEERIWFGTPNVRFRASFIKTSDSNGVLTASFSSEIRSLSTEEKSASIINN
ncbi:phycobiliprotein lyase [Okeania sp.]|uniref:phycobiliprotein lyase n=1 Tax=Okeania sp. TaxID=3100323 RepID=UPI002B4B895C|nr:phycobiliprotein lyase [Okeania sp.]MEB3343519.1 phycobiliprotein lyase [Okeania sp.]